METKKIFLVLLLVIGWSLFAQNVLQQFMYSDSLKLKTPLYLPDGKTPIPDSCLIEICIPVKTNHKNFEKDFHGKELHNNFGFDFFNGGKIEEAGEGFFLTSRYFIWKAVNDTTPEPVANCGDQIYLRIFDAPTIEEASYYRTSMFIVGPPEGSMPSELEVNIWDDWKKIEKPKK